MKKIYAHETTPFRKLRRKIADKILGDQLVLFAPKDVVDLAKGDKYLEMDDATLAAFTRHYLLLNASIGMKVASKRGEAFDAFTRMSAVTTIAQLAVESGTEDYIIRQECVFGNQDIGAWSVEIKQLPADYDFGPSGVTETVEYGKHIVHGTFNYAEAAKATK